jgi:hypothetical protein
MQAGRTDDNVIEDLDPQQLAGPDQISGDSDDIPQPVRAIRYYLSLKIAEDCENSGRYHYCCYCYPAGRVWPVGYCAKSCQGHDTKAGAREHYRQFLMDRFSQYTGTLASPSACAVCGRLTTHCASIDYHYEWDVIGLCPVHLTSEGISAGFVLHDYHLLKFSDPSASAAATIVESYSPVSIVLPRSPGSRF